MANIQETHNLRSIALTSNLASMAGDLEHFSIRINDHLFYKMSRNSRQALWKPLVTL